MNHSKSDALGSEQLEQLVVECLDRYESEGPSALEALCVEHPDAADDLRARIRSLVQSDLAGDWTLEVPQELGEFQLVRPLGGGGMGVVWLARQGTLAREVALKLIRPDQLFFPGARERFRREVELVAQLQHPGIVPVYTFGEERGLPYFAMERVRGCTLGEALVELRGSDPEELMGSDLARAVGARLTRSGLEMAVERDADLFRGRWVDTCARIVAELARALTHAHKRDILHRDLKPSNAMVTFDGRVQLFDFGLSTSREASKLTTTGSLVGSLPYMAPEQLDAKELGPRTDVYALGVTLYELLTLTQPFSGKGALATRDAILEGGVEPPRARNARVPRDLETVCLQAMAAEPGARYASAAELADDLQRVLDRKPVRARRIGQLRRAARWAQRRPASAAAALLATVLVVGGPLGFAIQRSLANADLQAALDETDAQRRRAEGNFDRAIEAVQSMLVEVGTETLENVPGMGPHRAALLNEANDLFEELIAQRADDPALRQEQAKLMLESASVLMELGRLPDATERGERAVELLTGLAALREDWTIRWDLARAWGTLGRIHDRRWDAPRAEAASQRAVEELEAALDAAPELPAGSEGADSQKLRGRLSRLSSALAMALGNRASSWKQQGRLDEALAGALEAIEIAERALGYAPDDADALHTLGKCLSTLAFVSTDSAQTIEAGERAIALLEAALAAGDPEPLRRGELARTHLHVAVAQLKDDALGQEAAEAHLEAGRALLVELVREHPYDTNYQVALFENRFNLARSLETADRAPLLLECLALITPLSRAEPDNYDLRLRALMTRSHLLGAWIDSGELDAAADAVDGIVADYEQLLAEYPERFEVAQSIFPHIQRGLLTVLLDDVPDFESLERILAERAASDERALRGVSMVYAMYCGLLDEWGDSQDERDAAAQRALDLIESSIAAGFDRAPLLREEERWESLHGDARFEELTELRGAD